MFNPRLLCWTDGILAGLSSELINSTLINGVYFHLFFIDKVSPRKGKITIIEIIHANASKVMKLYIFFKN